MNTRPTLAISVLALASLAPAPGWTKDSGVEDTGRVVSLGPPAPYELSATGFRLTRATRVAVEAVGLDAFWVPSKRFFHHGGDDDAPAVHAWILDASTRRPVWETTRRTMRRIEGSKALLSAQADLTLPPGSYEVYLFSGEGWKGRLQEPPAEGTPPKEPGWWESFLEAPGIPTQADIDTELPRCHVMLTLVDLPSSRYEVTGDLEGALIRLNRVTALQLLARTFSLDRAVTVRLYGVAERVGSPWGAADYAWIVDTETRARVWDSSDIGLPRAGGAARNRRIDHEVRLGRGRYTLYYGSDNLHSFDRFEATPPHDPCNYGVTMLPVAGFEPGVFHLEDPPAALPPLIEFARVRDGESREQAFRLRQAGTLHVTALGEISGGQVFDHAWILEAGSGDVVWEMRESNTRPGGGADKNRMFDGLVPLPAGTYVVHYTADRSHAWGEWNAALPFTPEAWGVTVRAARSSPPGNVSLLDDPYEGQRVIVRIERVGNDAAIRRRFTLSSRTTVDLYALGEGTQGRLHDYGWIEEVPTARRVWIMAYEMTDHAGGADKNRVARDRIVLEPGTYEACYSSDGSHAFDAWNAAPPRDPSSWGITLREAAP